MRGEKFAIISDVHGNFPAFSAVLDDAKTQGATRYLLLGDYVNGSVFGNEVVDAIRGLDNAIVIGGNHEDYLHDKNFTELSGLIEWTTASLTPESVKYLLGLPDAAVVRDLGRNIYLNHFHKQIKNDFFSSGLFREMFEDSPIPHEEFLRIAKEGILADPARVGWIRDLPDGVYLFGHSHIQFHMEFDRKLFINPGSCGEPLDGNPTAAYALLENGAVTERRVAYDIDKCVDSMRQSGYYAESGDNAFWAELVIKNLQTGFDYFRAHFNEIGGKRGK
ncbi:MAG: metallophosphoesterase family protein [Defluviitaleaceae bacterium]|nr:metallophosphoesterase family protein [Defluviitaleaceae bacterium]